jgi:hypothetical protein
MSPTVITVAVLVVIDVLVRLFGKKLKITGDAAKLVTEYQDDVLRLIREAQSYGDYDNAQRIDYVVRKLQAYLADSENGPGWKVPEGVIKLAVEYIYNKVIKGR